MLDVSCKGTGYSQILLLELVEEGVRETKSSINLEPNEFPELRFVSCKVQDAVDVVALLAQPRAAAGTQFCKEAVSKVLVSAQLTYHVAYRPL